MIKLDFPRSALAEGLFVNEIEGLFSWVDIEKREIFLSDDNFSLIHQYSYPNIPSNIFNCNHEKAIVLDDHGISEFYWQNQYLKIIYEFGSKIIPNNFRTNDGVMLSENSFLFGTMHKYDSDKYNGAVWLLNNNDIFWIQDNHIPNSFIELEDKILITDSYQKKIYSYSKELKKILGTWLDYSPYDGNPDGGFYSKNNFIYIAIWGESKIIKIDLNGNIISDFKLTFAFPTNCKQFKNKMIITSASVLDNDKFDNVNKLDGYLFLAEMF